MQEERPDSETVEMRLRLLDRMRSTNDNDRDVLFEARRARQHGTPHTARLAPTTPLWKGGSACYQLSGNTAVGCPPVYHQTSEVPFLLSQQLAQFPGDQR